MGGASVRTSGPSRHDLLRIGSFCLVLCVSLLAHVLLSGARGTRMLQLMDLAKENATLKCELERVRQEAEALQRLLSDVDGAARTAGASPTPRFPQIVLAPIEED